MSYCLSIRRFSGSFQENVPEARTRFEDCDDVQTHNPNGRDDDDVVNVWIKGFHVCAI